MFVPVLVDHAGEWFAPLLKLRAVGRWLLFRIAQRASRSHQAFRQYAEGLLCGVSSVPGKPADAGSYPMLRRNERDPLAHAPLVEGLLLDSLPSHS